MKIHEFGRITIAQKSEGKYVERLIKKRDEIYYVRSSFPNIKETAIKVDPRDINLLYQSGIYETAEGSKAVFDVSLMFKLEDDSKDLITLNVLPSFLGKVKCPEDLEDTLGFLNFFGILYGINDGKENNVMTCRIWDYKKKKYVYTEEYLNYIEESQKAKQRMTTVPES